MRVARRIAHIFIVVLALLIGATVAAAIVAETSWFKNWLRGYIVREASQYVNGQVSIARLGGNLFFGVELQDIGISLDGSQVVAVENLGLKYNVFELISKGLSVREVSLNKPVIYLRKEGDSWSIARLIKKQAQEADREGPTSPMSIGRIGVSDASLVIEGIDGAVGTSGVEVPHRIDDLDAELSFKYEPVRYSIEISHVSFRGQQPAIGLNALSGGIAVKDDTLFFDKLALRTQESSVSIDGAVQHYLTQPILNLRVSSDKLSLPEIARLVPSLAGVPLQPAFEVAFDGPLDRLGVDMNVRSSAGQITGKLTAGLMAPGQSVSGNVTVHHLDLAPLTRDPAKKSDLTLDAQMDVHASDIANFNTLSGTASVSAARMALLGYAAENVSLKARFNGRRVSVDGRASAYGASASTSGVVVIPGKQEPVDYNLHGTIRHLDVRHLPASLGAPPVETDVNADFAARGAEPMAAPAGPPRDVLADIRFNDSTAAGMRIERGSTASVQLRGVEASYTVNATVSNLDLARVGHDFGLKQPLSGSVPRAAIVAEMANNRAHVTADGDLADFDPSVASGRPEAKGAVAGSFDVDASIDNMSAGVTPDNVTATVRATLEPSKVGDLDITWANIDADYAASRGEIRDLEIVGRDLTVRASGSLALDDSGQSQVTFHADTPNLQEVAKIAGVEAAGIVNIDGTITGNKSSLEVSGKLLGEGVKYGEGGTIGALTTSSTFTAGVPDLDYTRASVSADTSATFVTVGGQEVNEVTATTSYADKALQFNAVAKQPQRTVTAGGAVAFQLDAQEIRLEQLALDTQGQQWRLAAGSPAVIHYAADEITVKDARLVSGDQAITASGAFGRPGDELTTKMDNVDVAALNALLLQPPQFTGRLNASAVVTGTTAAPKVQAKFQIDGGAFRQFRYDTLGGTADYGGPVVTVDARLQQNASQWLTAKGFLPTALFSPGSQPSNERVDLTIDSSQVDLGVVQGFTTQLTKVTGTLEAHVHVGGTASAPAPSGAITIQNGAAQVTQTGVAYNHIAGKVDLQPDRAHIDEITILDDNNNALSITGDLAIHENQLSGVQIYVNAADFKLLNNKVGDIHVQTNLEIAGDLLAPRVTGDASLTTGKLDLDEAMAIVGASPYSTEETQYGTPATPAPPEADAGVSAKPAPSPSMFDAMVVDVGLSVPNDFVVKANNLQTPGAPIGLGALNLTLGGDLHASKARGEMVRVRGTVNTVRGTYDFQGRRFDILRDGTIRFDGLEQIDPTLDIRAQRLIQGVTAVVNVRGRMNKPEIVLSSTPPLEQADILSLIVFNQPINEVSAGQQISLAARAEAMAAGAITSQLAQSIGGALGLDTFEINLAPENGGGPQVTLGQQVGQNLYVKVQQGVGDQSSTNFVLEYDLSKWLRLQTNVMQGASTEQSIFRRAQGSGADLIFVFSY